MAEVIPHSGLSLLDARRLAQESGMYLVTDGKDVVIAPQILPGWREVPVFVKITAPDSGVVCLREAA